MCLVRPWSRYGAPSTIWTHVTISSGAEQTTVNLTTTWLNKTTTRMAEASWVASAPQLARPESGW